MTKACPQCGKLMEPVIFDVGYGIEVQSLHCKECGFNITDDNKLKNALTNLREQMSKEVKIIQVGDGLGIRLPNDFVKNYKLKKGEELTVKPESDGIKLVTEA